MKRRDFLVLGVGSGALVLLPATAFCRSEVRADAASLQLTSISPLVRTGIEVELTPIDVFGAPTFVWADKVLIAGVVSTGGHALTIVAREITFEAGAQISTSSANSVASFPASSAALGTGIPGSTGADGAAGGSGNAAGDVLLVATTVLGEVRINAIGQAGGNGQSGGDGEEGAPAAAIPIKAGNGCKKGSKGGQGGSGGLAGRPGDGGNGGKIRIHADNIADSSPELNASGGGAGDPGHHGKPGAGGKGGKGGPDIVDSNEGPRGKER